MFKYSSIICIKRKYIKYRTYLSTSLSQINIYILFPPLSQNQTHQHILLHIFKSHPKVHNIITIIFFLSRETKHIKYTTYLFKSHWKRIQIYVCTIIIFPPPRSPFNVHKTNITIAVRSPIFLLKSNSSLEVSTSMGERGWIRTVGSTARVIHALLPCLV